MSYDVSSIYSGLMSGLGGGTSNTSSYTSSLTSKTQNTEQLKILSEALGGSSTSGTSNDLLTGMMIGMLSGGSNSSSILGSDGTSSTSGNSSSNGFTMIMSSLLNALSEKERQMSHGIDQNSQNASSNGISEISDVVMRALGGTSSTEKSASISTSGSNLERIEKAITSASKKYGVSSDLIRAIIKTESNYDPNAVSSAGAKGLMQLMPGNLASYGVTDPFNIEQNIDAGTRHIKGNLTKYGNNTNMALVAYNFGSGNMASRGITSSNDFYKLPTETKNYLKKINNLL